MSHLGPDTVCKLFKGMVERCADCGFDLAGGLVEVVPTAHYSMGGLVCGVDTSTELPGLFVAGEDASGMHGANRLGGNGVANSTVFGGIAGETMAAWLAADPTPHAPPDDRIVAAEMERAQHPFGRRTGDLNRLRESLLDAMWDDVGVIRDAAGLKRGLGKLAAIEGEVLQTGVADDDRAFNMTWHDWLNLRSLVEISKVIATAALWRENSRGAHFREDFPGEGDLAASAYTVARQRDGAIDITERPVRFTIVRPGQSLLKAAAE
jgi:fumarate reductase flavoprotein subunit